MMINTIQQSPAKKCLIIGLGQTGLSCARFLAERHYDVAVMDSRENPPALTLLQQELPQVVVKTGGFDQRCLANVDMIVLSPGVDPRIAEIQSARQSGVEIVGDIELFARHAEAPIVAITGSNGKSTVTTLLSLMAETAGKEVRTGGNLGIPALDLLSAPTPDFYIVELSSFQLETVSSLNTFAAVVLNLSADHLDRYDSLADYQQTKAKVYAGDGVMVINQDDPVVAALAQPGRMQIGFSLQQSSGVNFGVMTHHGEPWLAEGTQALVPVSAMGIAGKHNIANALAALALGSAMALPMDSMLSTLTVFNGLAHRCRLVSHANDIDWFNDSKATNVGACVAAMEGLAEADHGKIVLIAGGVGKGQDFAELTAVLKRAARAVVLIGQDADQIAAQVPDKVTVLPATTMREAVKQAAAVAEPGDKVLLSPACASFDMFADYAERGNKFEKAVKEVLS